MRTVHIKIKAHCVPTIQLRTRFLRILILTSHLESIRPIDICTRLDKAIYSSNENSRKLVYVNNPVITCYSNI